MVVHQRVRVPSARIISLGIMTRGVVMEKSKGNRMNWAMYMEWTNQEQQWGKGSLVDLE